MAEPRAQVRNAGSERQVRRAARKEREFSDRRLEAMRETLKTVHGRMLVWELLRMAGVYGSVWSDHGSRMAYNAGRQDYGHELLALTLEADENLYMQMEREARIWQRKEDRDTDAAHVAGDDQGERDDT